MSLDKDKDKVENPPELSEKDEAALDRIWDEIGKETEPLDRPTILRISDYLKADLARRPDGKA